MSCITDGRTNAALYFRKLGEADGCNKDKCNLIADAFDKCVKAAEQMWGLFGDTSDMEGMLKKLSHTSVRDNVCKLIHIAKKADAEALELMSELIE